MAEIKFEAPLAQFEDSDEWNGTLDFQNNQINVLKSNGMLQTGEKDAEDNEMALMGGDEDQKDTTAEKDILAMLKGGGPGNKSVENFNEMISGSLEDLVNTFDEKITKCFGNFDQPVEELAPVQMRSQEEIMSECQMWWTITGNFGNILPIDWSKSYARQMHIPALKLNEKKTTNGEATDDELNDLSSEDEAVAQDLDMHALILGGMHSDPEPIKTAEEVMKEIDEIMDETDSDVEYNPECEAIEKAKEVLKTMLYQDKLEQMTISQLNELYMEMETIIRELSETLITELALRDECEYEKELKNSFISLLLAVQNRRRQYHIEKKKGKAQGKQNVAGTDPKYLTTVIPYHMDNGPPENQTIQALIKILKAINEDSPTVPTLLTDYILKVLCPT